MEICKLLLFCIIREKNNKYIKLFLNVNDNYYIFSLLLGVEEYCVNQIDFWGSFVELILVLCAGALLKYNSRDFFFSFFQFVFQYKDCLLVM